MVYSNKLIAVVKVDGKIIREDKDIVRLPFGCEYSILLKNLGMTDAVINVDMDGVNILSNNSLVVRSKQTHELLGFLNNSGQVTNRFKFIQKTDNIVKHRGDHVDDGFINISFQFVSQPTVTWYNSFHTYYPPVQFRNSSVYGSTCSYASTSTDHKGLMGATSGSLLSACCSSQIQQDEGITVKGSQVSQQYQTTYISNLDPEKHNIILRLKGQDNQSKPVVTPVYTNTKLQCSTCGRKSKSNIKFCPECGTSLK